MTDSVHNRIVDAVGFSEQRSPDCEQWSNVATFEDSSVVDYAVWCPEHIMIIKLFIKMFYWIELGSVATHHAMNHNEIVIRATLANLHSALVFWASAERKLATFIFLACSRIFFSWAATAYRYNLGIELSKKIFENLRSAPTYLYDEPVRIDDQK